MHLAAGCFPTWTGIVMFLLGFFFFCLLVLVFDRFLPCSPRCDGTIYVDKDGFSPSCFCLPGVRLKAHTTILRTDSSFLPGFKDLEIVAYRKASFINNKIIGFLFALTLSGLYKDPFCQLMKKRETEYRKL